MAVDLTGLDAYHLHEADRVAATGGFHWLVPDDSYLETDSDSRYIVRPQYTLSVNPLNPPNLPVLKSAGRFGVRASLSETLPGLQLSAKTGARLDEQLSDLRVTATGTHETLIAGSRNLPTMSLVATVGARSGTLTLADLGLSAEMSGGLLGRLSKSLPGLTISATGYAARTGSLDVDLPPLSVSLSMDRETLINLNKNLPAFKITATGSVAVPMSVDAMLPALEAVALAQSGSMTATGVLPPPIMVTTGLGISGLATRTDKYDDYVLRHERF